MGVKENLEIWGETLLKINAVLMTAIAAVIIGTSSVVVFQTGDTLRDFDLMRPAMTAFVTGVIILLLSIVGCVGVKRRNQHCLVAFMIGNIFITLCLIVAGGFLLAYRKYFENVANGSITNELEERILTYELAAFAECCDPTNPLPDECGVEVSIFPCFVDVELFNTFRDFIGDTTCGVFEDAGISSREDPGGCAGQNQIGFVGALSGFLIGRLSLAGALDITFGVMMFLMAISANLCAWDLDNKKSDEDSLVEEKSEQPDVEEGEREKPKRFNIFRRKKKAAQSDVEEEEEADEDNEIAVAGDEEGEAEEEAEEEAEAKPKKRRFFGGRKKKSKKKDAEESNDGTEPEADDDEDNEEGDFPSEGGEDDEN